MRQSLDTRNPYIVSPHTSVLNSVLNPLKPESTQTPGHLVRKARHRDMMQATHLIRHMRSLVVNEDEYGAHKVFTIEDNQKPYPLHQICKQFTTQLPAELREKDFGIQSRSTCPPLSPSPHANIFAIGTAVINAHTH